METISDDESLFFGSVLANLAYHPGSVHLCNFNSTDEVVQFHPRDDKFTLHSMTTKSLSSINADYTQIFLPDMPTSFIQFGTNIQTLSDEFRQPLIKTKLPSHIKCIVSGVRSGLIKSTSSKWYRLKGCGNNTDGFLIQPISNRNKKLTIRGCAFLHTTYRELFMTNYISHLLLSHKIQCGNSPIGWFEYKSDDEKLENIDSNIPIVQDSNLNQWPNIVRCCIVMETLGNKRLSDHVLFGIEQLLNRIICDNKSHPVDQCNLISLFSTERLVKIDENNEQLVPLSTWLASLTEILRPINYKNSNWLHLSSHFSKEIPSDIEENRWQNLWKINIEILNNYLHTNNSLSELLCLLYQRFGYESGSILGLMHYHRISWGTYTDELGMHCNAHPNNLIIKLPSSTSPFFLAPLDFDMSFIETSYLSNQINKQSFDEIIKLELASFQLTIGGDPQGSTGVTAWKEMSDDQWASARWLLRDIMLNEFNSTYNETVQKGVVKTFESFTNEQTCVMQALIRLALVKTINETA